MKKLSLFALVFGIILTSFREAPVLKAPPLPLCTALANVMKEEPTEFVNLKGKLISEYESDQNYELKFNFEGWASNEWVKSDGAISVDITSDVISEKAAKTLFDNTSKQISTCLGLEGKELSVKGTEKLLIFTKDKNDVALMLMNKKGKYFVLMSISRES